MSGELTDPAWWDAYWSGTNLPETIDSKVQWHRRLSDALREELPHGAGRRLVELGCAPGRWLAWFALELGYDVTGCDSSAEGIRLTRENLRLQGVDARLYATDFLIDPLPTSDFDVVFSLGLVEHFTDPLEIVRRHADLVRPGGLLVLEVPNFVAPLNRLLMRALGMDDFLAHHNLDVMHKRWFRTAGGEIGFRLRSLRFIGGFDPTCVLANHPDLDRAGSSPWKRAIISTLWRIRAGEDPIATAIKSPDSPLWSHMLLGVFEKPR